ncbi:uncharacterized protein LOC117650049 [Thrips palmi]|uniref:Uncharacterized protein LOC117650049 n=1 Tax=Thrips palmi TaxID=161013 RepID=A0A6P8ZV62_THRPL|nr:uncharacterized protein LOC117650049 [Thrips palmi]
MPGRTPDIIVLPSGECGPRGGAPQDGRRQEAIQPSIQPAQEAVREAQRPRKSPPVLMATIPTATIPRDTATAKRLPDAPQRRLQTPRRTGGRPPCSCTRTSRRSVPGWHMEFKLIVTLPLESVGSALSRPRGGAWI